MLFWYKKEKKMEGMRWLYKPQQGLSKGSFPFAKN